MNERISIFSNREGKDGMNLLLEEDFYEIVRCEILKKKFKVVL